MGESFRLGSDDGRDKGSRPHQHAQPRRTNWLPRLVARVPVRIRTKLLVALAAMVIVLVVIGGLGLRVLGESNERFGTLATLQQNAATYRSLQNPNSQLRELVAARTSLFPGVPVPTDDEVNPPSASSGSRTTCVGV